MIKYGSVCSGVEAASLAWRHMGWKPVFFSEIEPFPCAVLKHRFPEVPNLGDMTKIKITKEDNNSENKQESIITGQSDVSIRDGIDLLVGGTPCQDLSVAGKRKGFAGVRSGLALDYCRIAYESGCRWILWENVPGTFSSAGGRDFATFLSVLSGRQVEVPADGWANSGIVPNIRSDRFGLAWRCLDAQFTRTQLFPHAVPQRRQRLFVVGYLGNWIRAAQVLLEPDRLQWDTPTRFKARERITGLAETNIGTAGANNAVNFTSSSFGNYVETDFGGTLKSSGGDLAGGSENLSVFWNGDDVCTTLTEEFADARMPDKGKLPCVITTNDGDVADTLDASYYKGTGNRGGNEQTVVGYASGSFGQKVESDTASTLSSDQANTHGNEQIVCYENHANDSRVRNMGEVCQTLNSRMGTGGGNLPLVQERTYYKWHSPALTATEIRDDCAPTILAAMCTGGTSMTTPIFIRESLFDAVGVDQYNMSETGDVTSSLGTNCGMSTGRNAVAVSFEPGIAKRDGGESRFNEEFSGTLRSNMGDNQTAVAIAETIIGRSVENGGNGIGVQNELAYTQNATVVMGVCTKGNGDAFESDVHTSLSASGGGQAGQGYPCARIASTVRRLLPIECERLMGFPDNWTKIPYRGKSEEDCPDSPRYKACGNSMCVNVMQWIGEKIQEVEQMINEGETK